MSKSNDDWRPAAGIPRRSCIDLNAPAELAIRKAIQSVEYIGADPLLTESVVLLSQAFDKLADYIDTHPHEERPPIGDFSLADLRDSVLADIPLSDSERAEVLVWWKGNTPKGFWETVSKNAHGAIHTLISNGMG